MREWPDAPVIRYLTFGNTEVAVANSLEAFRELLQTKCYDFRKPDRWHRILGDIIGKGVINMEGEDHKVARKMLTGAFNVPNSRKLIPVFQEKATEVSDLFERAIAADKNSDDSGSFTLDTFGVTNFGVQLIHLRSITFDDDKLKNGRTLEEDSKWTFHKAYETIFAPESLGGILMFANAFVAVRWLPIKENRDFKRACDFLQTTLRQLISERIPSVHAAMRAGTYEKANPRNLLTFIAEEMAPGGSAEGLTEYNLLGHMLQFMAAGSDTSANTLSWSVYVPSKHHAVQDKLRAEIQDLYKHDPNPPYQSIDALRYLDADEIRPERWYPENATATTQSPYAFQAFSNGPRICTGKAAATIGLKIIFVEMVRKYRFIEVETELRIENPSLVLKPTLLRVRVGRLA